MAIRIQGSGTPHKPKEAIVKNLKVGRISWRHRFDGVGEGTDPVPPEGKRVPLEQQVREELEKRYQPKQVREWLATHRDDKDLALEKALEIMNDRFQKQIKTEVESRVKIEELEVQLKTRSEELTAAQKSLADLKAAEEQRTAAEREAAVSAALAEQHPGTSKALALALKNEGYALELDGKEVMVAKDGKRHRLATILNDDFYKEYPFAKPTDDSPLGGSRQGGSEALPDEIAKAFAQSHSGDNSPFDWSK